MFHPRRTISPEVAAMLKDFRLRRGWSLREAARRVGVAAGTIVHLEKARRAPDVATTEGLIRAYKLTEYAAELLWSETVTDAGRGSSRDRGRSGQ